MNKHTRISKTEWQKMLWWDLKRPETKPHTPKSSNVVKKGEPKFHNNNVKLKMMI